MPSALGDQSGIRGARARHPREKQAINGLIKIGRHIAEGSPISAGKMIDFMDGKVTPLSAHPQIDHACRKRLTHELVAHEKLCRDLLGTEQENQNSARQHTAQQWPPATTHP